MDDSEITTSCILNALLASYDALPTPQLRKFWVETYLCDKPHCAAFILKLIVNKVKELTNLDKRCFYLLHEITPWETVLSDFHKYLKGTGPRPYTEIVMESEHWDLLKETAKTTAVLQALVQLAYDCPA